MDNNHTVVATKIQYDVVEGVAVQEANIINKESKENNNNLSKTKDIENNNIIKNDWVTRNRNERNETIRIEKEKEKQREKYMFISLIIISIIIEGLFILCIYYGFKALLNEYAIAGNVHNFLKKHLCFSIISHFLNCLGIISLWVMYINDDDHLTKYVENFHKNIKYVFFDNCDTSEDNELQYISIVRCIKFPFLIIFRIICLILYPISFIILIISMLSPLSIISWFILFCEGNYILNHHNRLLEMSKTYGTEEIYNASIYIAIVDDSIISTLIGLPIVLSILCQIMRLIICPKKLFI